MADRLKTALARLAERRKAHQGRTVTYRRGAYSVEVTVSIGETVFRMVVEYGAQVRVVRRDYLLNTVDLVLNSQRVVPQAGDRIEETDGDSIYVHEVMGPGGGEPAWRYSDPYRRVLRIHTKHVGTEAVP